MNSEDVMKAMNELCLNHNSNIPVRCIYCHKAFMSDDIPDKVCICPDCRKEAENENN